MEIDDKNPKKVKFMKNWNIWFFAAIIAVIYFGNSMIDGIKTNQNKIEDKLLLFSAKADAISVRLDAKEKEVADFYKLQKNQDTWQGTGCVQCHNTLSMSLPINKITIAEAIDVVRNGTEASRAGGMPQYSSRGTRDRHSITDSELKVRLDALYTKELLQYAKEKESR